MFRHDIQVYYEDTDFTGVVYHANYLKFCERAREHILGTTALVKLFEETGIGFVVYRVQMTFREGARFGDLLEVQTTPELESPYRIVFQQDLVRKGEPKKLVETSIQLVCVDAKQKLVKVPTNFVTDLCGTGD